MVQNIRLKLRFKIYVSEKLVSSREDKRNLRKLMMSVNQYKRVPRHKWTKRCQRLAALWVVYSNAGVVLDDSPSRTNEPSKKKRPIDFEPSSTEVVCGNISCGGFESFDGAQNGETAEGFVFEPSRLVI